MNTDKIFKRIWNINGLILLIGLLIIITTQVYQFTIDLFRDEVRHEQTLDLADDNENAEKWSLGYPEKIPGSKYYLIPLESENMQVTAAAKGQSAFFRTNNGGYGTAWEASQGQ